MNQKINFLATQVDNLSMDETVSYIEKMIRQKEKIVREDINAAKIVWMQKDSTFAHIIQKADLINADGQSIILASKLLGNSIKERVSGIDLMEQLVSSAYQNQWKIFFLGASEEVILQTVNTYINHYSKEIIAGYHNGYFSIEEEKKIVDTINQSNANILFIGISSPKKEYFIKTHVETLNCNLIMGVGGSFDVVAGKVNRAPVWMQKSALEWFYRLLQEPRKMWKRYLYTNTIFIWLVFKAYLLKKDSSSPKQS